MSRWWDAVTLGPQRRARRMHRLLAALDASALSATALSATSTKTRSRGWSRSKLPGAMIVIVAILGFSYTVMSGHAGVLKPLSGSLHENPPPGQGEALSPRGRPPRVDGHGGYAFSSTQDNSTSPVAWDPCRQIHYVVAGSPTAGQSRQLTKAIAEISVATGLQFVADGPTKEVPSRQRKDYQPGTYGDRWAPLLVAWTSPDQLPDLAGATIGQGGATEAQIGVSPHVLVSGIVYLDQPQLADLIRHQEEKVAYAVMLHELGHAVGLAHVNDDHQVMYPETTLQVTDLGPGDRRGLAQLGQGACVWQL